MLEGMTASALPPLTFSALAPLAMRLLAVLWRRPAGLYRALAQALRYLEAVTWGRLASVVVWDGSAEAPAAPKAKGSALPPLRRTGRDPWAGLIARATRLLALLRDQDAARRVMARRIGRRPALGERLMALSEAMEERDPPWVVLELLPVRPSSGPNTS